MLSRFVPAGFRGRLFVTFLAIAILPLIATGFAFFRVLEADLERETLGKLSFATHAKQSEITQYLTFAARQAESLSHSNTVRYSIGDFYGFSYAFRQIDPSRTRASEVLRNAFGVGADVERPASPDGDALTARRSNIPMPTAVSTKIMRLSSERRSSTISISSTGTDTSSIRSRRIAISAPTLRPWSRRPRSRGSRAPWQAPRVGAAFW